MDVRFLTLNVAGLDHRYQQLIVHRRSFIHFHWFTVDVENKEHKFRSLDHNYAGHAS